MNIENISYQDDFPSLDRFIQPVSTNSIKFDSQYNPLQQKNRTRYEVHLKKQLLSLQKQKLSKYYNHGENSNIGLSFCNRNNIREGVRSNVRLLHSFKTIKLPNIIDDFYLNLLDWSSTNFIAIGLKRSLYSWSACSQKVRIIYKQPKSYQICSIKFNQSNKLAVGNNNGIIKIYDIQKQNESKLFIGHLGRVSSLDWNNSCLASGSIDGYIIIWDLRINTAINIYKGHHQQISGIKWNPCGSLIASGGNDNKLVIFDNRVNTQLIIFKQHTAAIKALDWCPSNSEILASGGGTNDGNIRFFNTKTLTHLFSIDTGSQICNLTFSKISNQMLTTHGYNLNQINIWNTNNHWKNKQSITNTGIMLGHSTRVLYLATGPNGDTIATAAGDKTIRFWHPFQNTKLKQGNLDIPSLR